MGWLDNLNPHFLLAAMEGKYGRVEQYNALLGFGMAREGVRRVH